MRQPAMTPDEVGDRANVIYEQRLRAKVETEQNIGKIIAIDILTEDYEIDKDNLAAALRLRARLPNAEIFAKRIGYEAVYTIGGTLERAA